MNWNIEKLSWNKIQINGMATAIARTVHSQNIDILVLLEVCTGNVVQTMNNLSNALNTLAGVNNYKAAFISQVTGGERYGFIIKNLDLIRPLRLTPQAGRPNGSSANPLNNLKKNSWSVWPSNIWTNTAYPVPGTRPNMPLTDLYASNLTGRKRNRFGGQAQSTGRGYSLGRGFRLPCLAMFMVHTATGNYLVPVVCCHYAAVRGGRNALAQGQVNQMKNIHIAQMFDDNPGVVGNHSHYINVDNNAERIQEIIITGDFNMDFLRNNNNGNNIQRSNRRNYNSLTPTIEQGGSNLPIATPALPVLPAPGLPFAPPFINGPFRYNINNQALKAAVTTQGTHLIRYRYFNSNIATTTADLKVAAFDNFFYGGTQASGATINFGTGNADAGEVIDVPANIVQNGAAMAAQNINLSGVWAHYNVAQRKKNANIATDLGGIDGFALPLDVKDRLIGARLVSDHLPVVLEFNCP